MSIVTVQEATLEQVQVVHKQVGEFDSEYLTIHSPKHFKNTHVILVATINGQPAGYMIGYERDHDGSFYCWMTGVIAAYRKHGALTEMMKHFLTWSKTKGYSKVTIKTWNARREMLSFLVKNGFHFTNIEPHDTVIENRIWLEKAL